MKASLAVLCIKVNKYRRHHVCGAAEASGKSVRYELDVAKTDGTSKEIKIDGATGKVAMK